MLHVSILSNIDKWQKYPPVGWEVALRVSPDPFAEPLFLISKGDLPFEHQAPVALCDENILVMPLQGRARALNRSSSRIAQIQNDASVQLAAQPTAAFPGRAS